jgi:DNA-binding NarL/FixJ family response regulator
VLLVDLPPLVRDVIARLLADEDSVEVVESSPSADLESAVQRTSADVIVLPADRFDLPVAGRRFLEDRGNVRVVGLVDHARSGVVGQLAIQTGWLEDLSKASLVDAITGRGPRAGALTRAAAGAPARRSTGLDA